MNTNDKLHEMDPLSRFSDRAEAYARFRPDYPLALFDAILDGLGDPAGIVVADVGAGTGISSRMLADRGPRVLAIEPNAAMREAADAHPRVEFREASSEATGLEAASVQLVTAFQAFHWFDAPRALVEFRRVLVPKGRLAVAWNERDEGDPFTRAYSELVRELSGDHPAERRASLGSIPFEEYGFVCEKRDHFPHWQEMDLESMRGRALSTSYLPSEEPGRSHMLERLSVLHDGWADPSGVVRLVYQTSLAIAHSAE